MGYSLYLCPCESHQRPDSKEVTEFLLQIQCATLADNSDKLIAGPKLMELVTYLGCSPAINIGDIKNELHVHLFSKITGLGGNSIESLHYPRCKHQIADPITLLASPPTSNWYCTQCDNTGVNSEINWRKSAAYSDLFIEITDIFPKEAIPSEQFINALMQFSSCNWKWFYSLSSH